MPRHNYSYEIIFFPPPPSEMIFFPPSRYRTDWGKIDFFFPPWVADFVIILPLIDFFSLFSPPFFFFLPLLFFSLSSYFSQKIKNVKYISLHYTGLTLGRAPKSSLLAPKSFAWFFRQMSLVFPEAKNNFVISFCRHAHIPTIDVVVVVAMYPL